MNAATLATGSSQLHRGACPESEAWAGVEGCPATMVAVKQERTSPSLSPHAVQIWESESCTGAAVRPLILRQGTPAGEGRAFPPTAAVI